MRKTAILFDVYGTLISTGNGSVAAAEKILRQNNSNLDPVGFYTHWKKIHKQNMRCDNGFLPERDIFAADLCELYEIYGIDGDAKRDVGIMLESLYNREVFPETKETLSALSKKYELIIASNTDTEPLLQNFAYNGLHFNRIFTSESLGSYKPNQEFYSSILQKIKKDPNELIFIGDSICEDILAPKEFGMSAVLIDRKKMASDHVHADLVLHRLPTVEELQSVF